MRHPVHVTLRARADVPSLRCEPLFGRVRTALTAHRRDAFRVIHYSVQIDHVHMILEADSSRSLVRGIQGLAIRCARVINRTRGACGPVWNQRYHARPLTTPTEVRAGLVYVLSNFRKHLRAGPGIDPLSSGLWFDGWAVRPPAPAAPSPVARPRTWLASVGWLRAGGPIDTRESPSLSARS